MTHSLKDPSMNDPAARALRDSHLSLFAVRKRVARGKIAKERVKLSLRHPPVQIEFHVPVAVVARVDANPTDLRYARTETNGNIGNTVFGFQRQKYFGCLPLSVESAP